LRFDSFITPAHFDVIAKVLLAASIVMGLSYATEWLWAWYSGTEAERGLVAFLFTGPYAPLYYAQLLCNVIIPQSLWAPAVRRNIPALVVIAVIINIGMWLERILLIWTTLGRDFLPSMWRLFLPSFWDWSMLFGSLGFFAFLFMIFARVLPAMSIHELRVLLQKAGQG
jgi:molybdopterin-containing oxidoreductase family membrane subunit